MHESLSFDRDFHDHCAVREMQTDPVPTPSRSRFRTGLNACGKRLHKLNNQRKP
jgi:hypothetical protein